MRAAVWLLIVPCALQLGCAGTIVQPGHRALLFDPSKGGVQQEVLQPGYYSTSCGLLGTGWFARACPRVDDFDVTYTRQVEQIETSSKEGLGLAVKLTLVYRPIVSELYLLDTEVGPNFYEEVVGPEFRSAARGVFARNSYLDLQARNEGLENDIEAELRRRIEGKHVSVESVLLEEVVYAKEIVAAVRAKLVGEQEALRQKALMETEGARKKREIELAAEEKRLASETEITRRKREIELEAEEKRLAADAAMNRQKLELENEAALVKLRAEQERLRIDQERQHMEQEVRAKKAEHELAIQQAAIDQIKAQQEASMRIALAKAKAEENKAEALKRTSIDAAVAAYDALGKLGGTGTTILLGDWSKAPPYMYPHLPGLQSLVPSPWGTSPPKTP